MAMGWLGLVGSARASRRTVVLLRMMRPRTPLPCLLSRLSVPRMTRVRSDGACQRRLTSWIQLACVLLFAAMAAPFFWGRVVTHDDLGAFHLPVRDFYATQLARGESFDWMPSLYSGFYLTGEGQAGMYHPLHWLLYRLLPLGAAFNLALLLSYPLMLGGT